MERKAPLDQLLMCFFIRKIYILFQFLNQYISFYLLFCSICQYKTLFIANFNLSLIKLPIVSRSITGQEVKTDLQYTKVYEHLQHPKHIETICAILRLYIFVKMIATKFGLHSHNRSAVHGKNVILVERLTGSTLHHSMF